MDNPTTINVQLSINRKGNPFVTEELLLHWVSQCLNCNTNHVEATVTKIEPATVQEHSQVVLTSPLPALKLEPGDVGVVVHVHGNGVAYEVEFMSLDGNTIGVETVQSCDLRAASRNSVPHERERIAA